MKNFQFRKSRSETDGELSVEVEIGFKVTSYSPGRPAPNCQDHDDPRFSDPGDSEECEFDLYWIERIKTYNNDGTIKIEQKLTKIVDEPLYDEVEEQIFEWCRENLIPDDEDPDAYDRWRDEQADRERD